MPRLVWESDNPSGSTTDARRTEETGNSTSGEKSAIAQSAWHRHARHLAACICAICVQEDGLQRCSSVEVSQRASNGRPASATAKGRVEPGREFLVPFPRASLTLDGRDRGSVVPQPPSLSSGRELRRRRRPGRETRASPRLKIPISPTAFPQWPRFEVNAPAASVARQTACGCSCVHDWPALVRSCKARHLPPKRYPAYVRSPPCVPRPVTTSYRPSSKPSSGMPHS